VIRVLRIALGLAALAFVTVAVAQRWHDVRTELGHVGIATLLLCLVTLLAAQVTSMLAWRALLADLGSPLTPRSAARVLFVAQIGKYIPGSLWSVVAQAELANDHGVPRRQAAAGALVHNALSLAVGLLLALLSLPALLAGNSPRWALIAVVVSPLLLLCFVPPVLTRLFRILFRVLGREPIERPFSWSGVLHATGLLLVMWLLLGLHIWLLGAELGASRSDFLLPAVGGFAVAWSVGFLVIIAPAGAGARELLLVLTLAAHLPAGRSAALTIAVVSRLLMTVGDVLAAGVGLSLRRHRSPATAPRAPSVR